MKFGNGVGKYSVCEKTVMSGTNDLAEQQKGWNCQEHKLKSLQLQQLSTKPEPSLGHIIYYTFIKNPS